MTSIQDLIGFKKEKLTFVNTHYVRLNTYHTRFENLRHGLNLTLERIKNGILPSDR